jgi:hypothetical protein
MNNGCSRIVRKFYAAKCQLRNPRTTICQFSCRSVCLCHGLLTPRPTTRSFSRFHYVQDPLAGSLRSCGHDGRFSSIRILQWERNKPSVAQKKKTPNWSNPNTELDLLELQLCLFSLTLPSFFCFFFSDQRRGWSAPLLGAGWCHCRKRFANPYSVAENSGLLGRSRVSYGLWLSLKMAACSACGSACLSNPATAPPFAVLAAKC